MSYEIELSDEAETVLRKQPLDLRIRILDRLDALAANPVELSRKVIFPHLPVGQLFQFWCEADDTSYFVTVFFQYSQDETTLEIFGLSVRS